jgi:hypothetical protein
MSTSSTTFRDQKATYMFTWVGLANTPRLLSSKQNCQAVRPRELAFSSMTTASAASECRSGTAHRVVARAPRGSPLSARPAQSSLLRKRAGSYLYLRVRQEKGRYGREAAPAVGTSMLARPYTKHDILIREHSGYRIHAPRESFSKKNYVRANAFVLYAQHFARPAKALIESMDSTQSLFGK